MARIDGRKDGRDGLVTVADLSRAANLSTHQVNDYISRGLLKVARREGRVRMLEGDTSRKILKEIHAYIADHGNLNMCLPALKRKFPTYYGEA